METKQERMEVYSPRMGPGPITGLSNVSSDSQMKAYELQGMRFVHFGEKMARVTSNPIDTIGEACCADLCR